MEDFQHYKGIVLRGWRFIAICVLASLTIAVIYIAAQKPTYKASSRLLVIYQGGHPVQMRGGGESFNGDGRTDGNLATHLLLLKSPIIIEQALNRIGEGSISVGAVIGNLTVKQPDPLAKIVDLVYKSKSPHVARRVLDGVIESYKLFLKSNYQKNSSEVISLMTKARNELSAELKALEEAYLEYHQKNPSYSADSTGHSFVVRRLDQWDQILNQFSARSLQLQSQLELGKKMSRQGVDPATIASTLSQVGMVGGGQALGSSGGSGAAGGTTTNDGSYVGIARDLVEVESRRKMAELYLEHFQRENKDFKGNKEDMDREIESRFLAEPVVLELKAKLDRVNDQLAEARRIARSNSDPAVLSLTKRAETLRNEYQRQWDAKSPEIEETLSIDSNPALGADYRVAEAEVITLKAREAALRERLDQVAVEELEKLHRQHETLRREHGDSHPQVAQLKERIAGIEGRQQQSVDVPGGGTSSNALLDHMSQSLESIEAMRVDLQKKFDEDLELSKQDEITMLEESNLRNNLERQRSLYLSVLDQLKQARLVSDYDSVSTQMIAPISVNADPKLTVPILLLAAVIGVGLGAGVAFLADMLEARVRTLAEIRKLVDVPLIGVIPLIRDDQAVAAGTAGLLSHQKPRSALAESYKATRTNLEFLRRSRQAHVLLVASSLPGDGKSTTVSNLAISLANAGRRVLLVDGDLRKPSLHRLFDLQVEGGFADALLERESVDRLVKPTFVNNLHLLTTGRDVSNPAEMLASERLGEMFKELRSMYDMILIDSSPLLLVTDASIIAAVVDGIVLVLRLSARRHDLDVTNDLLKTLGVPVFGMVINGVTREEAGYGYGGYGYGGYGYGVKNGSPYGPSDEPAPNGNGNGNGNGALPHDWKPAVGTNGKLGHENGTADRIRG